MISSLSSSIGEFFGSAFDVFLTECSKFSFNQFFIAAIALFAMIDILGSIPIIINLREKGLKVNAMKATLIAFASLVAFFYVGEFMLNIFSVDIKSFAVAGSFVIFFMALEMILDIEIFKYNGPVKEATLVPLVFPLLAGAATFTLLLTLRSKLDTINIMLALTVNMLWVYVVVRMTEVVERILGKGGIYITRKLFGLIILAIAVKMFTENITELIAIISSK